MLSSTIKIYQVHGNAGQYDKAVVARMLETGSPDMMHLNKVKVENPLREEGNTTCATLKASTLTCAGSCNFAIAVVSPFLGFRFFDLRFWDSRF